MKFLPKLVAIANILFGLPLTFVLLPYVGYQFLIGGMDGIGQLFPPPEDRLYNEILLGIFLTAGVSGSLGGLQLWFDRRHWSRFLAVSGVFWLTFVLLGIVLRIENDCSIFAAIMANVNLMLVGWNLRRTDKEKV